MSSVLSLQPIWLSGLHGCTSESGSTCVLLLGSLTVIFSAAMDTTVARTNPSASVVAIQQPAPTLRWATAASVIAKMKED